MRILTDIKDGNVRIELDKESVITLNSPDKITIIRKGEFAKTCSFNELANIENNVKNIENLCKVEDYILENEKALNKEDTYMIRLLEHVMEYYTYGWYIIEESMFEQLKSINRFKVYVLGKI